MDTVATNSRSVSLDVVWCGGCMRCAAPLSPRELLPAVAEQDAANVALDATVEALAVGTPLPSRGASAGAGVPVGVPVSGAGAGAGASAATATATAETGDFDLEELDSRIRARSRAHTTAELKHGGKVRACMGDGPVCWAMWGVGFSFTCCWF